VHLIEELRMKRTTVVLSIALIALTMAIPAMAQEEEYVRAPYKFAIGVEGGVGIPSRPDAFNDLWNSTIPVSISVSYAIIPWVEVMGSFCYGHWGISEIPAKDRIRYVGVASISGGTIQTMYYGAGVRLIPFPNIRLMPYFEVGGGAFSATAENLEVEGNILVNSMDDVSGPAFSGGGGLQYAVNESWNVYTKINWTIGFNEDFNPENLVLSAGEEPKQGGKLQYGALVLGIILKI
jgi:hypothetical protein